MLLTGRSKCYLPSVQSVTYRPFKVLLTGLFKCVLNAFVQMLLTGLYGCYQSVTGWFVWVLPECYWVVRTRLYGLLPECYWVV